MGLSDKTQKSTGSTTSSYGWQTPPTTPALEKLAGTQFQVDPTIGARAGEAQRTLQNSFNNPVGGFTTPAMRDAMMRSGSRELMQRSGEETRAGQYDVNKLNYGRDLAVAGMSAPTLTQTGGTSQGTVTQGSNPVGGVLQGAASLAPLSM